MQSVFGNLLHSRSGGEEKHSEKETQEKRGQRMGRGKWYIKLRQQQFFGGFFLFRCLDSAGLNVGNETAPKETAVAM